MKKIALVFAVAVIGPSLVLAWLAIRSLQDQHYLLERQQSLLCQGISDRLARDVQDTLTAQQQSFDSAVAEVLRTNEPTDAARMFDDLIRNTWSLAEVGFAVTPAGELLSPSSTRTDAQRFLAGNGLFLANRESAEVYYNNRQVFAQKAAPQAIPDFNNPARTNLRTVMPQQQVLNAQVVSPLPEDNQQQFSRLAASEAEFRQLIGEQAHGMLARFVNNKLTLLLWQRPATSPDHIFGAQISLAQLQKTLHIVVEQTSAETRSEYCLALLDENAKPVASSQPDFRPNWRQPFAATEIGEALPHWEAAVYLLDPGKLTQTARQIRLTLGLLIAVLLLAIGIGSWLIVADLNRQLTLARQKTDFVSNVSHELKTPLTSIRMFSELLAEGRVSDPAKQRSYLGIITAETARLTRLINNVLDFTRLERGEKKFSFAECDFSSLAKEALESYRPHLVANGFAVSSDVPAVPAVIVGDRDALAQVLLNLLSNAEKYCDGRKEIEVVSRVNRQAGAVELRVLDRGLGVPRGAEEKIFEKFFRAHDALSSGIQGSGLGLTLAREIVRAHGGDLRYERREGGGSCFVLQLPLAAASEDT